MKRNGRDILLRGGAVLAAGLASTAMIVGCSSDDSDDSDTAPTSTTRAAECGGAPTAGDLRLPTEYKFFTQGSAQFEATLDDGTSTCVTVRPDADDTSGTWQVHDEDTSFKLTSGDARGGLVMTLDDDAGDSFPTSLPGAVEDPFIGLQVNGAYFPDSGHDRCQVQATALSAELVSASFTCKDMTVMDDTGPFTENVPESPSTATKLISAKGWFVASA